MNGHQNVAFSHLIGALKSPRNLNGYGADYADFEKFLREAHSPRKVRRLAHPKE